MKKSLLWILVLLMSVLLVAVFSSGGCRRVEEVTDEPEEEALDESEAEEIVKELLKKVRLPLYPTGTTGMEAWKFT